MNIPGVICAAEHYDLPDLLQACFHHAKQFVSTNVVSKDVTEDCASCKVVPNLNTIQGKFEFTFIQISTWPFP